MQSEAKRAAQDALFTAIKNQAENNMKAALRATEKAGILRDLAEAYRLAAGTPTSGGTAQSAQPPKSARRKEESSRGGSAKRGATRGARRSPRRMPGGVRRRATTRDAA